MIQRHVVTLKNQYMYSNHELIIKAITISIE